MLRAVANSEGVSPVALFLLAADSVLLTLLLISVVWAASSASVSERGGVRGYAK